MQSKGIGQVRLLSFSMPEHDKRSLINALCIRVLLEGALLPSLAGLARLCVKRGGKHACECHLPVARS